MLPRVTDAVARVFSNNRRLAPWSPNWTRGAATDLATLDGFVKSLNDFGHAIVLMSAPAIAHEPLGERPICGFILGGKMGQKEFDARPWMKSRGIKPGMGSLRYVGVEDAARTVRLQVDLDGVTDLERPIQFDELFDHATGGRKLASALYEGWCRASVGDCETLWMGTQRELVEMWQWGKRLGYTKLPGPAFYKVHFGLVQRLEMFSAPNTFYRAPIAPPT